MTLYEIKESCMMGNPGKRLIVWHINHIQVHEKTSVLTQKQYPFFESSIA